MTTTYSSGKDKTVAGKRDVCLERPGETWPLHHHGQQSERHGPAEPERLPHRPRVPRAAKATFGLDSVTWPYSSESWDGSRPLLPDKDEYAQQCRLSRRRQYGGKWLALPVADLSHFQHSATACGGLPTITFHSVKQGAQLLATFADDLGFADELGFVCYADTAVDEHTLNYDGYNINLSSNPICSDACGDLRQITGIGRRPLHQQYEHRRRPRSRGS